MKNLFYAVAFFAIVAAPPALAQDASDDAAPAVPEAVEESTEAIAEADAASDAEPADEGETTYEEIRAYEPQAETAVVSDEAPAAAEGGASVSAAVNPMMAEMQGEMKSFGVQVVLDHAFGTGSFVKNRELRRTAAYAAQSWQIQPYMKVNLLGKDLKLSGKVGFELEFTQPDMNDRRFKPSDISVALADPKLFKFEGLGVNVSGEVRGYLPTSYESIGVKKQWTALSGKLAFSRAFGNAVVMYSFGMTKYVNGAKIPEKSATLCRVSDGCAAPTGIDDPTNYNAGYANSSFMMMNAFVAAYNITELLGVSYSLAIVNMYKYKVVDGVDEFTSINADPNRGRMDLLAPSLSLSYGLSDGILKDIVDLPGSLSLSAGIAAMHPAQKADNTGILWPVFFNTFGNNRAANNYGSFFVDLVGVF